MEGPETGMEARTCVEESRLAWRWMEGEGEGFVFLYTPVFAVSYVS